MGYKKDSIRKGRRWFSLRASHPLSPFNKFPSSCLTAQLVLFFSSLALHSGAETRERRSTSSGWASLTNPPPVVPSPGPCRETETSSGAGLSTHGPTFHPSATRVSEIPFPRILSLSPHFQVLELSRRIPTADGLQPCAPSDFEIGDAHFKADYYYSLRKSLEQGRLFSPTFLLTFSRPCLTSLFDHNRKFSIPALKIYSSRMPSLKPKSFGLPKGDKTKKTSLVF